MAGQTISAYVSEDVAVRLRTEAKREGRTDGQIAGQAIRLFTSLPREARASFAAIEGLGTARDCLWAYNEIARILNIAEFSMTERRLADQLRPGIPPDASDEDIDRIAVEWTLDEANDLTPPYGR